MPSQYIVIPLAFQIIAIIFSPVGLALSSACNVNPFNNPNCTVTFNQPQAVAFTINGYSYVVAAAAQACNSVSVNNLNKTAVFGLLAPNPLTQGILLLSNVPGFSNIFNFFEGLGLAAHGDTAGAAQCNLASTALLTFTYDGKDIALLFIGAIITAGVVAALSSVVLNAGAAFIVFTIAALGLIYLILSALAFPTWATIPTPFGSILYSVITLAFAIGIVGELGSIAA